MTLVARERNYIGSYRLLKMVRAGATCQIWEVMDEVQNRRCALKALQQDFQNDKEQISLLKHEYMVGKDLHHPCVIEVYDFSIAKGVPYMALEIFNSSNLKQRLRQMRENGENNLPCDPHDMPDVIRQCAEGLAYLNDQGWIHRDVKPDNFLINDENRVKLIDFAIAEKPKKGFVKFLSGKSKVQGTRSYMSPEQIRGESLDVQSDVYSFGCMMYELHCGRPPFTGGNADQLLQKHLKAPIPSLQANCPQATPELANLISMMMAKKREKRPPDMHAVLKQMQDVRLYKR